MQCFDWCLMLDIIWCLWFVIVKALSHVSWLLSCSFLFKIHVLVLCCCQSTWCNPPPLPGLGSSLQKLELVMVLCSLTSVHLSMLNWLTLWLMQFLSSCFWMYDVLVFCHFCYVIATGKCDRSCITNCLHFFFFPLFCCSCFCPYLLSYVHFVIVVGSMSLLTMPLAFKLHKLLHKLLYSLEMSGCLYIKTL